MDSYSHTYLRSCLVYTLNIGRPTSLFLPFIVQETKIPFTLSEWRRLFLGLYITILVPPPSLFLRAEVKDNDDDATAAAVVLKGMGAPPACEPDEILER